MVNAEYCCLSLLRTGILSSWTPVFTTDMVRETCTLGRHFPGATLAFLGGRLNREGCANCLAVL